MIAWGYSKTSTVIRPIGDYQQGFEAQLAPGGICPLPHKSPPSEGLLTSLKIGRSALSLCGS